MGLRPELSEHCTGTGHPHPQHQPEWSVGVTVRVNRRVNRRVTVRVNRRVTVRVNRRLGLRLGEGLV